MNENTPVIIGRYRLSKTLGIGAFGKVKCEHGVSRLFDILPYSTTCVLFSFERETGRMSPLRNMALFSMHEEGEVIAFIARVACS